MAVYEDILGKIVGGRYRVTRPLGAGNFGQVFEATQEVFNATLRTVALKLFTKDYVTRNNAKKVFKEALMLEAIATKHRSNGMAVHLVTVYDMGVLEDYQHIPYVAMELVDGGTLDKELDKVRNNGFPVDTVVRYGRDICAGLKLAHEATPEKIVHHDIKPANVLLTTNKFLKLSDFGVAVDANEAGGNGGGDIRYASPDSEITPASDIYSVGITMLEMLLGYNPIERAILRAKEEGKSQRDGVALAREALAALRDPATGRQYVDLKPEIRNAPRFQNVLGKCLALLPITRFGDAGRLAVALGECGGKLGESDDGGDPPEPTAQQQAEELLRKGRKALDACDLEQAEMCYERLRLISTHRVEGFEGLSEVFEKKGNIVKAVAMQQGAVRLKRSPVTYQRLSDLLRTTGRISEADAARRMALTLTRK